PGRPPGLRPGRASVNPRHSRGHAGLRRVYGAGAARRCSHNRRVMSGSAFDNVLDTCLAVRAGEQVVLVTDDGTDEAVVDGLREGVGARGAVPVVARIPTPR